MKNIFKLWKSLGIAACALFLCLFLITQLADLSYASSNHYPDITNNATSAKGGMNIPLQANSITPTHPIPADGESGVPLTQTLSWQTDASAITRSLYISTSHFITSDLDSLNIPTRAVITTGNSYTPTLTLDTTYYWAVTATNGIITGIAGTWSFTTTSSIGNQAPHTPSNPIPVNGATNVPVTQTLSWQGGDPDGDLVTYTVYLTTTQTPTATAPATVTTATSYTPATLLPDTTYYWVVTATDGLSQSVGNTWSFTTAIVIEDALLNIFLTHKVAALAMDQDDYWLGTRSHGVIYYQAGTAISETYSTDNSDLLHDVINDIAVDPNGDVWIATNLGVSQFVGSTWQNYTRQDGLASNHVDAIAVSPSGVVWFGTKNGLSQYDGANWTTYTQQDGLPHSQLIALGVGEDEMLWGVTVNGTFGHFDGNTWETIEGSPSGNIDTMAVVEGVVYLGTNRGLVAYENGAFTSIEPQMNINEVAGDDRGWIWAISESGQLEVQAASSDSGVKVGVYDPKRGRWLLPLVGQRSDIYLPILLKS
jgi:hypothetical protein